MQIVSDAYKSFMSQPVRPPFHMRITVHTDTPIIYTDDEIFEFEEKKTAHPIGAELPSIEVSFKVDNIAGDYNPESPSGLYEQLIKGVKVTYEYGLEIPQLKPYGYTGEVGETPEPTYGMDEVNPYGFLGEGIIEWIDGGEVYTTGEISYDKTSATIEAVDALSFLEETADVAYGTINRKQCAQFIIEATDYPIDNLGAKKIMVDNLLETWNTNLVSDNNAKQVLQSLAHASGVQIYIDRGGYLHLDKLPITTGTIDYHVTLGEQDEDGDFTKGKTPRKVTVKVNTTNVVPEVSETINPKGEDILVENGFIQTSQQAQVVLPWVKRYLGMRNIAEINYAGEPALDILDIVLLDTEYGTDIPATVVETMIHFDGAITGSLVLRYDSTLADTSTVKITGAENFTYDGDTPSPASVTLVCETDMTTPSYEWSYFNDSSSGWQTISGATTANLTIIADSAYFDGNKPTSFRVAVTGAEGTKGTSVRIQRVQEPVEQGHKYLGKLGAYPSAYDSGDYFLVSSPFGSYILGDVVQWTGTAWAVTTHPSIISTVYQDALTLSLPLGNASAVNQYIRSLQSKQILLSTDVPVMFFYSDNTPYDGGQISTITASRLNLATGINWYINGDLVADIHEDTINVYDTDMNGDKITVTAVSTEYTNVSAVIVIAKQKDRALEASNLGLITTGGDPKIGNEGAPLVAGDYFMWGQATVSSPNVRKKGAVYIRQVDGSWLEDSNGTKTMSMFAQFAGLPEDTEDTVIGNAIVKNLAVIKAFIERLEAENITAGTGNGTTGGFRFRAKSRTDLDLPYDATTNPSVFDVTYDDRKLFEVDPESGNTMFGNYNPSTKSGGILYDYVNDKLLGNVAYDQWDLVIESDADFALLGAGDHTEYKRVLVTAGNFTITQAIQLDSHYVEVFRGLGDSTKISMNYDMGNTPVFNGHVSLKEIGGFNLIITTAQTGTAHILSLRSGNKIVENIKLISNAVTPVSIKGMSVSSLLYADTITFQNCYVKGMALGYYLCKNLLYCTAENCTEGFDFCHTAVGCKAIDCTNKGFYRSEGIAGCVATGNDYGLYECYEMGGCLTYSNTTANKYGGYEFNELRALSIAANSGTLGSLILNSASLGTNGYTYLPNGMIMQWGYFSGGGGWNTVNFPIAFPNSCGAVITNSEFTASGYYRTDYIRYVSNSSFQVFLDGYQHRMIAIGW